MPLSQLVLTVVLVMPCMASHDSGTIRGTVLNGSQGNSPVAGAEVVLQVQQDGGFVPIAKTTSDGRGQFSFDELPVDERNRFLPGASHNGVHYPGERVRIGPERTNAVVRLIVYDTVMEPSPLVALRHEILLRPESRLLNVAESILVSNPSSTCYVGQSGAGDRPVTLRLAIPSNFEKVTFHKEFFGRRFMLIDGSLLTNIPWPPGDRELKFSYILPIEKQHQVWDRPLDLPCTDVRVTVVATEPDEVSCNLSPVVSQADGEVIFESNDALLAAGHVIHLEFGRLPVPVMANVRWIALGILTSIIVVAAIATQFQRRRATRCSTLERPSPSRAW